MHGGARQGHLDPCHVQLNHRLITPLTERNSMRI